MEAFGNQGNQHHGEQRAYISGAVNHLEATFRDSWAQNPANPLPPWHPTCLPAQQQPQPYSEPPPPGVPADVYHRSRPEGPPPGLVRTFSPLPTPIHLVWNGNASLFGDFARYLDTGVDENGYPVNIDLTCVICLRCKLIVPLRVTPTDPNPYHSEDGLEKLAVLPCGHFFGSKCLEKWCEETDWQFGYDGPPCPICRFELIYSCGHTLPAREYDPTRSRIEQMPLTLPEGGQIPRLCESCCLTELNEAIERLKHLLFPQQIVPGDLRDPNHLAMLHERSVTFRKKMWQYYSQNQSFNRCYAPNWLPYFAEDGQLLPDVTLSVECGICKSGLAITQAADDEHETFTILPCGHVFGHACILEWFGQQDRSRRATCPQCRKSMMHVNCGHRVEVRQLSGGTGFNVHRDLQGLLRTTFTHCDFCVNDIYATRRRTSATARGQSEYRARRDSAVRLEEELIRMALAESRGELRGDAGRLPPNIAYLRDYIEGFNSGVEEAMRQAREARAARQPLPWDQPAPAFLPPLQGGQLPPIPGRDHIRHTNYQLGQGVPGRLYDAQADMDRIMRSARNPSPIVDTPQRPVAHRNCSRCRRSYAPRSRHNHNAPQQPQGRANPPAYPPPYPPTFSPGNPPFFVHPLVRQNLRRV
ncbi:hypothetical protein F5Y10DRAFT_293546 [Nemania abortiva]|nr:hypothetical protein F5Y10DRAFT_293546 [Nemania abortiva]